jgi:hypothetical protein
MCIDVCSKIHKCYSKLQDHLKTHKNQDNETIDVRPAKKAKTEEKPHQDTSETDDKIIVYTCLIDNCNRTYSEVFVFCAKSS